ncbi:hypothetical protein [Halosimplex sp. TS25]|uniref:DUF7283 family protein n=1 Tax=Halosimplex rarum TaxID=3396619 RepID=UPI0039E921B4
MDFEAPADAWYVFLGVSIVSVAMFGVVQALPSEPPPDGNAVANTVDDVAGSGYNATGTYEHDADEYFVHSEGIRLRNDGGRSYASISFGELAPVWPDDDLKDVLDGVQVSDVYGSPSDFETAYKDSQEAAEDRLDDGDEADWLPADGRLRIRHVVWKDTHVTLVDV